MFLASTAGRHHLEHALPCQDAVFHRLVGDAFVGAVCDGAGSALEGRCGAQFLAAAVVTRIAEALGLGEWPRQEPAAALRAAVGGARDGLQALADERGLELRDFATTLIGCVGSPAGGCFFHVGDGYGVLQGSTGEAVLSPPENGEYADQTYFVTDDAWAGHLRLTPFAATHPGALIGLMSDGTSPFAIDRARTGFYRPFIDPVTRFLAQADEEQGNRALRSLLEDEKTHAITADDKTLLLAMAG